jgi:putative copper resistance protein D
MSDSANVVLRFVLYVDLMLLLGVALFGLYSFKGQERLSGTVPPFRRLLMATAGVGALLAFALMAQPRALQTEAYIRLLARAVRRF